jgi:hypothetical protein
MSDNSLITVTDEQMEQIDPVIEKWEKIMLSTEPGDKGEAEKGFIMKYDFKKLDRPKYVLWTGSIRASVCIAGIMHYMIKNEDVMSFCEHMAETKDFSVDDRVTVESVETFEHDDHSYTRIQLTIPEDWYYKDGFPYPTEILHNVKDDFAYGQFDAHWHAYFWFFREVVGLVDDLELVRPELDHISENASWWATYKEGLVIATEKMSALHLEDNNLHNTEGPAIEFPGGQKFYSINGVHIPGWLVNNPEKITPESIDSETNMEIKRIMLEIYGEERYLVDSGCEVVDDDPEFGTLLRKEMPNDEPLCFLRVINSTPEVDGTYKTYMLRTSPEVTTAKEAQWRAADCPVKLEDFHFYMVS